MEHFNPIVNRMHLKYICACTTWRTRIFIIKFLPLPVAAKGTFLDDVDWLPDIPVIQTESLTNGKIYPIENHYPRMWLVSVPSFWIQIWVCLSKTIMYTFFRAPRPLHQFLQQAIQILLWSITIMERDVLQGINHIDQGLSWLSNQIDWLEFQRCPISYFEIPHWAVGSLV